MIKLIREVKSKWYAGKDVMKLMLLSSLFGVFVTLVTPLIVLLVYRCVSMFY